ncbi:MAG TPA: PEP-CTERM sorting domain-containing protein [Pirellulales bacterium]|nr:PEP-CTERM sorting domain-containing protein [Pirellulales bacterium]
MAGPLHAGVVSYTGSDVANSTDPRPNSNAAAASFLTAANALGPTSLITFESAPLGSFHNYAVAPGVTMNGTDGVTSADQTIVNSPYSTPDGIYGYNTTPSGSNFVQLLGGNLVFSFSPSIQSFGAYFTGVQTSAETITFSDGSSQSVSIPEPGTSSSGGISFVGFTDAGNQIASVTINALGDIIGVDDVRFGFVASTPEPGTLTLLGLGLLAIGGSRFFRRRALRQI